MSTRSRRHSGFTLLEMMITVAIVGILASIAIPQFRLHQARTRRSEAYANVAAIAKSQKAYFAEYNVFVDANPKPGTGTLSTQKREWDASAQLEFAQIGWAPEGNVYYDYDSNTPALSCGSCSQGNCFTTTAYGDVDGNGITGGVMFVHPNPQGQACPSAAFGTWVVEVDPHTAQPIYDRPFGLTLNADLY